MSTPPITNDDLRGIVDISSLDSSLDGFDALVEIYPGGIFGSRPWGFLTLGVSEPRGGHLGKLEKARAPRDVLPLDAVDADQSVEFTCQRSPSRGFRKHSWMYIYSLMHSREGTLYW